MDSGLRLIWRLRPRTAAPSSVRRGWISTGRGDGESTRSLCADATEPDGTSPFRRAPGRVRGRL